MHNLKRFLGVMSLTLAVSGLALALPVLAGEAGPLDRIVISPDGSLSVIVGETIDFDVVGFDVNDNGTDVTVPMDWSVVSGTGAGTIDADGLFTATAAGDVVIDVRNDSAKLAALSDPVTILLADQTIPVITLIGDATVNLTVGGSYTDAGATAIDNVDGDITAIIVKVSTVNTAVVGSYTVTYNVTDSVLNHATQVTRTVNVEAVPTPPAPSGNGGGGGGSSGGGRQRITPPSGQVLGAFTSTPTNFISLTPAQRAALIAQLRPRLLALLQQLQQLRGLLLAQIGSLGRR